MINPKTGKVEEDPICFTGKKFIRILPYWGGFVGYLPEINCGLCGGYLRKLGAALITAADRVDELNRSYEAGKIKTSIDSEHILIEA